MPRTQAGAASAPAVRASGAVLVTESGRVLYEKNADMCMPMASTTKLMTALIVSENTELDDIVEIKPKCCGIEGSSMYLKAGDKYTVRELLLGLLLVSGNDAAAALADYTAGSEAAFVRMMNDRASELGMADTSFRNPHGLDEKGHYSTAADMAKLMRCCMNNMELRELCGTKSAVVGKETLINHNRLLWRYSNCVAGKTGYTSASGRCLVTASEYNGEMLICVTLNDGDDWNDHIRLYQWGFGSCLRDNILADVSFDIPVAGMDGQSVRVVPAERMKCFLTDRDIVELRAEMPRFIFPPVKTGETAGKVWVIINNEVTGGCTLVFAESTE